MTGSLGVTGDVSQLLLGICAGALLTMAAAMLRAPRPAARWTGVAFFLSSTLFAIKLWCGQTGIIPQPLSALIGILAMSSVGWFWLMVMALFQDCDRYKPWMFIAPGAMMLCGLGNQAQMQAIAPVLWIATHLLQLVLAAWSLAIILQSWKDDLVEQRRHLRGPFMIAVALYIISLVGVDVWSMIGDVPHWYPMANAAMLAAVVLAGAFVFLDPNEVMFGSEPAQPSDLRPAPALAPNPPASTLANGRLNGHADGHANGGAPLQTPVSVQDGLSSHVDRAAKADLDRLDCLMKTEEIWREEGLTIASLATRVSIPEHQLRRLINDRLGYRNFPSFINAHRVAAAKHRLADPNESRVSVSTIAFDLGFASLGPFNRAFKEETGVSPTEWRKSALAGDSPIPEMA